MMVGICWKGGPNLPGTVPVFAHCISVIINSIFYSQKWPDLDGNLFTDVAEFREDGTWERGGGKDDSMDWCQGAGQAQQTSLCKAEPRRAERLQPAHLRTVTVGNTG